jgi:acylphosphatase
MVQKIITFSGQVQLTGFRERLQDLARGLGITGFVENIIDVGERFPSNEAVKVFVDGKERAVETFIEFGTVQNSLINVSDVDISDIDDDGIRFTDFYIHRDRVERELGDRLDVGIELLKKILEVQKETLVAMRSGHDRIIDHSSSGFEGLKRHISQENEKWFGSLKR